MSHYSNVNLYDPRQDVHRKRGAQPTLNRYNVAEKLFPESFAGRLILELGGGAAEFSQRLQRAGYSVTFVDLSVSAANVARASELGFSVRRLGLNLGLPGFADSSFDGVIMLEIIEHVIAAEQLLQEVNRVLRPGGFLILSTPNFGFWPNRLRILFGGLSEDEGYHYRFFTPDVLRQRLDTADLTVESTAHTTPAMGYNFVVRHLSHRGRKHVHVPDFLAPLLAHTLIIRARKERDAQQTA